MSTNGTLNDLAAASLLDELWRAGVRDVAIAPGGRSTPLAVALARDERLRPWMITDERSAAFFALGAHVGSGRPTAVVCTSGTAAANFLPAVVEAFRAEVPLIVLTADRPTELRDCGAAQTIRQPGLYRDHVKWSTELATPDPAGPVETHVRSVVDRAVAIATREPCGPVHLNVPYREPLTDIDTAPPITKRDGATVLPRTQFFAPRLEPTPSALDAFVDEAHGRIGIIVCGPSLPATAVEPVCALAERLAWPVLADPLSGVRFGNHDRTGVVDAYDLLLRDATFAAEHSPEAVLRFGALPTSKPLNRFLAGLRIPHTLVSTAELWADPDGAATRVVAADPAAFCSAAAARASRSASEAWCRSWTSAAHAVRAALADELDAGDEPFEGAIAAHVIDALPDDSLLMVGNSMPVRDVDTFAAGTSRRLRITANRGANGIDGVIATALGTAAMRSRPTALLIGDLSALHDIGSLQIAARHRVDLTIVAINNDGGGIFSFLPQARLDGMFEPFFGTPHGLDLQAAAAQARAAYTRADTLADLDDALADRAPGAGLRIIEIHTRRDANVARHRAIVASALSALPRRNRAVA